MAAPAASKPFVVAYGEEDFLLDRDRLKARTWAGRQVVTLNGDGLQDYELVEICRQGSFDESMRVVILDEANKVKGDKALKSYIKDKDERDITTILVAVVRSDKLSDVWTQAGKKGLIIHRPKMKTYESDNEVVKWLAVEAKRVGIRLAKGVAEKLFEFAGPDLGNLAGEIQKLELIIGRGSEATLDHLRLVLAPSPSAQAWQVAEAVADKDFLRAMNLLSTLYKSEGERANVTVVGAMMKQIERFMICRGMLDAKMSEDEMASALGMNPKRVKYVLAPVHKHTMPELIRHMNRLSELDAGVKGSSRSKRTLVELTVISIAKPIAA
jgi:DNA polymerase III subunit delta